MVNKKIFLIVPSFTSGGAERVISQLCIHFSQQPQLQVSLICLIRGKKFYKLPANVRVIEPDFIHSESSRLIFSYKIFLFLRKCLKDQQPDIVLSFGGRYNSFVLLAALGLGLKVFVSDRSRPGASYGKLQNILNPAMYKRAAGIVAQTKKAKEFAAQQTGHKNIAVIGNPIRQIEQIQVERENIILNIGRFILSKHQLLLVEYFAELNDGTWKLVFLGDGKYLEHAKKRAIELGVDSDVEFCGVVENVDVFYRRSKIFAFTSTSEGFPNVLGEAMGASLAVISFDCNAGPSDLIYDGINGFLVPEMDHADYKYKLQQLMKDDALRTRLGHEACISVQKFNTEKICSEYLNFILAN